MPIPTPHISAKAGDFDPKDGYIDYLVEKEGIACDVPVTAAALIWCILKA